MATFTAMTSRLALSLLVAIAAAAPSPPPFVIIDVRTPSEWGAGHVSCAKGPLAIQDGPAGWQGAVAGWTDWVRQLSSATGPRPCS